MSTTPGPIELRRQSELAYGRNEQAPGARGSDSQGADGYGMDRQPTGPAVQRFIGQLPQSPSGPKPSGSSSGVSGLGSTAGPKTNPSKGPELAEALDAASEALAAHQLAQLQRRGLLQPEVF
jgi:hypothetical protein